MAIYLVLFKKSVKLHFIVLLHGPTVCKNKQSYDINGKNKLLQTFLQNGFEESRDLVIFPLEVEVMKKAPFKIATRQRKSTYISLS